MSRTITHVLLSKEYSIPSRAQHIPSRDVRFKINRTGKLRISVSAPARFQDAPFQDDSSLPPIQHPFFTDNVKFGSTLLDPDGAPFERSTIERADLDRFRDNRGVLSRNWTLRIHAEDLSGEGFPKFLNFTGDLGVSIAVTEKMRSLSAPMLLDQTGVLRDPRDHRTQTFEIDLYRLGTLKIRMGNPLASDSIPIPNAVTIRLIDPTGRVFASGRDRLDCKITPIELALSRGPDGAKRLWTMRVKRLDTTVPPAAGYRLSAQVYETLRISTSLNSVLQSRLDKVFGNTGRNLTFGANRVGSSHTNQFTLTINDPQVAETFGMHDVLDGLDENLNKDLDLNNPEVGPQYVLGTKTIAGTKTFLTIDFDYWVEMKNLETESVRVSIGPSQERRELKMVQGPGNTYSLVPTGDVLVSKGLPGFVLKAATKGTIKAHISGWDDAEMVIPQLRIEIGLGVDANGRLDVQGWIYPESIQYGGEEGSAALVSVRWETLNALREKLEAFQRSDFFEGIFDFFMGGPFRFTATRWANDAMEFEYVAGVEPERRPNPRYHPFPRLGPSSSPSPNLAKIDHIVVLMMENRSFDHVLGHLSLDGLNTEVDGLTPDIIKRFSTAGQAFRPYSQAKFTPQTQFPLNVGHEFRDVQQQLEGGMQGFVANFKAKHKAEELAAANCEPDDVLGYHPIGLLPMYDFLSKEFVVCDRFYSSHPGPTLPNRMFSLTGQLQYDRFGEPQLENAIDSHLLLSRDLTIFDLLNQRGISWRVYESPPSVTMLRFFSRYAGEDTLIRDIQFLKEDVQKSGLPSVTFIDPQFHYSPANDDHPPADMLRGQHLVKRVYNALRSNPAVWNKTLLVITYDEHGGFFDHVVPEIAEVLSDLEVFFPADRDPSVGTVDRRPDLEVSYGVRVPTFLISPWVDRGKVFKNRWDHTSILKTILNRFCAENKPFLSDRVAHAADLGSALSLVQPRSIQANLPNLPNLPEPAAVAAMSTMRIIRKAQLTRDDADWQDFMEVLARLVRP